MAAADRINSISSLTQLPTGPATPAQDEVGHIPVPATTFVGRSREVAVLSRLLTGAAASRLVTLTGPSGIGKTRLALEIARRVAPSYPNGAWLVELAPLRDPDLVPRAVAAALRVPLQPTRPLLETLVAHLRANDLLIVLDNCEHLVSACSALCEALMAATDVSILATTQRALGVPGERSVSVAPMSLPAVHEHEAGGALRSEAVRLFCERAVATTASFELTDETAGPVAEICLRLDGIPLAIELAAARANVLAPVEIAERLEGRLRLLTRGAGTSPDRHQTLRASLDWSYGLLSAGQAALLRRLSVFAGGAPLTAVEEVSSGGDVPREDVVDLLSDLVACSLVSADTKGHRARYRLLETVREYGRERLAEADEQHAHQRRHAEWCRAVCEAADRAHERSGSWDEVLLPEFDNVAAALQWAEGHDPDLALQLATLMYPYWKVRGEFRRGQLWLERTLRPNPGASAELRSQALRGIGMLAVLQGDIDTATSTVEESLATARQAGLLELEALSLNLLGFIAIFTQDAEAAMPLLEESVALNRRTGNVRLLLSALALYGRARLFVGDSDGARKVFEECLELAADDLDWTDVGLLGLAWSALLAGRQREATDLFARTLVLLTENAENSENYEKALVRSFLGELAWFRGDLREGRAHLEDGLALARTMGAPFPMARCLAGLARIAMAEGDRATAAALAEESCELARTSHLPYAEVRCLLARGVVMVVLGDLQGAQRSADEALAAAQGSGDQGGAAAALHQLARLARLRGCDDRAASLASEALAIQVRLPDAAGLASSLELLAGLAVGSGQLVRAARLFGAAEAIRAESGSPCPPDEVEGYEDDVVKLDVPADPEVEQAWAAGAGLSPCEAAILASKGRGPRDRPTRGWAALTPAERQVAELAVLGLTNNEIGERLFVSPRTVQGHLLRIFPKLGVTSRRQLREMAPEG